MWRAWHSLVLKCMCKWLKLDLYSSSGGLGIRLALVHAGTKQPAWIYMPILELWRPWLLQKLKMKEQVATSPNHFLIVDYRVLCDDQSTLEFILICMAVAKGSKTSRTWLYWHAGTFDISACIHWPFDIILAQRTTLAVAAGPHLADR